METLKDENGGVGIEAIIVYVIAIMVVFLLMNFAMFTYQKGNVTASANQAAADVANIYAHEDGAPYMGFMKREKLLAKRTYRYFVLVRNGNIGKTQLDRENKKKARWYAASLIYKTELIHPENFDFSDISAEIVSTFFGKRQLKVTIKRKYPMLAVNPFKYFGVDTKYTYEATGYAECYDMIDYINKTNLNLELEKRIFGQGIVDSIAGIVNNSLKLFDRVKQALEQK